MPSDPRPRGRDALIRRGRTAVVVLLLAWVATQVGLSYAANFAWPDLRDPMFFDKLARLRSRVAEHTLGASRPLTVVMFGSSRTLMALDGQLLEEGLAERTGGPVVAFNFGIPAAGPVTNAVNVRRLLTRGPRPDVVLIEVLPPLVSGHEPVPREYPFLLAERLLPDEVELVRGFGFPADETRSRWQSSALVPVYGLRFPILGRLAKLWLPMNLRFDVGRFADATGWAKPYLSEVSPEEYRRGLAQARQEYYDLLQGMRMPGHPAEALRLSLELCRAHGVPAALVLMPEGTDFRAWYPPSAAAELNDF